MFDLTLSKLLAVTRRLSYDELFPWEDNFTADNVLPLSNKYLQLTGFSWRESDESQRHLELKIRLHNTFSRRVYSEIPGSVQIDILLWAF